MATQIIRSGHVPYEVLKVLAGSPNIANRLRAYFAPRCNCDVSEYIKTKIQEGDTVVVNAIKAMIAADVGAIPDFPETNLMSANGDRFCLTSTFERQGATWGNFVVFDGTTATNREVLIEENTP